MKICMLGAGAMGCTIGGMLASSGADVIFVDPWREQAEALNLQGLEMHIGDDVKHIAVTARETCAEIGVVDLVIVFVKSFQTKEAITQAKDIIGDHTMILSLQNGLGNEEEMMQVIDQSHLICGRTYAGGSLLRPGVVKAGVVGKETYIGEPDGSITERIQRVADLFRHAGLECNVSRNIKGLMWDKLLINVATSALTSTTRLPYGPLYEMESIHECALEAVREGIGVAKSLGIRLSSENPEDAWKKANANLPYDFKPSMLQGLEAGRRSEIDFINGTVVRFGMQNNVPTPVNKTLVACVKGIERWIEEFGNR